MSSSSKEEKMDQLREQMDVIDEQIICYKKMMNDYQGKTHHVGIFDMDSWLSRRRRDFAGIRDVRGASILLTRSIIQFLIPEKGIKLTSTNEKVGGNAHSKCNKDIRIGVTAACKEFGMKITGRGSIAGCESSNLIDIPIICDVLQSVGVFEDSSFPNPSDKGEKGGRKGSGSKKNAIVSSSVTNSDQKTEKETLDQGGIENSVKANSVSKEIPSEAPSNSAPVSLSSSLSTQLSESVQNTVKSISTADSSKSSDVQSPPKGTLVAHSLSTSNDKEKIENLKYAPNIIDIEEVMTTRWDHQLRDYLSDMQKRKTPFHYHAADGISSDGVAMVASYRLSTPTPKSLPKPPPKIPSMNCESTTENTVENKGTGKASSSPSTICAHNESHVVNVMADQQNCTMGVPNVTLETTGAILKSADAGKNETSVSSIFDLPSSCISGSLRKKNATKAAKQAVCFAVPFEITSVEPLSPSKQSHGNRNEKSCGRRKDKVLSNDCLKRQAVGDDTCCSEIDDISKGSHHVRPEKRAKLEHMHINTNIEICDPPYNISSSSNKMLKSKDVQVVISPATGGVVGNAPTLPPRIGSGGVGGTTTGYSLSQHLLIPSLEDIGSNHEFGSNVNASAVERMNSTQRMLFDPAEALQSWSNACYEEGMALAEEERLLRYISGICELSLPHQPFRIGLDYLDPDYSYIEQVKMFNEMKKELYKKEEKEYEVRDETIRAHCLEKNDDAGIAANNKKKKASSHGNGKTKLEKAVTLANEMQQSHSESQMLHSAASLDSTEASCIEELKGEDFEKVTSSNVALTATMLWQRAKANACYKPSSVCPNLSTERKQRPLREKKDFFESYLSDTGGQSIASAACTNLAAIGGMKNLLQADNDKLSSVVLEQVDKIKKGSKSAATNIATLHPGALESLTLHGVSNCAALPIGQPGGGLKRQRSLSNIQQGISTAVVNRSSYLADTIGGYPSKNTTPPLNIYPSLYGPTSPRKSKTKKTSSSDVLSNTVNNVIHSCPQTNRLSLKDLTVYSVKMPWKFLAQEFEVFDPAAMDKDYSSHPRTPTSLPPTSPRFSMPSSSSPRVSSMDFHSSQATTSNLNGPMGVWVATTDLDADPNAKNDEIPAAGLRITAPQNSAIFRRRGKRNSDGALVDFDSSSHYSSPRMSHVLPNGKHKMEQFNDHKEFRRIAFSDVIAPKCRLIENDETGRSTPLDCNSDEDEEDISDEAILKRHEATLASMRDKWKAIQDLKASLKKSSSGEDPTGTKVYSVVNQANKRKRGSVRPSTPKEVLKPSENWKHNRPSKSSVIDKVVTRRSKSPSKNLIDADVEIPVKSEINTPIQKKKRGRPRCT